MRRKPRPNRKQPPADIPSHFNLKIKAAISLGALGVGLGIIGYALAGSPVRPVSFTPFTILSGVSVPEMPAKAADLIQAAAVADREKTAQAVLRAVATIARPGVLPYVVSAICRRNPEVAGPVVTTAIELQPPDVLIFCQAAVSAAPGQVEQIVAAACQASPGSFANVALVAFRQLPAANNLILAGLARARPDLKSYLEKAEIQSGPDDFEAVIKQTVQLLQAAAQAESRNEKRK